MSNTEALTLTKAILKVILKKIEDQESATKLNELREKEMEKISSGKTCRAAFVAAVITFVAAWLCWSKNLHLKQ